MSSNQAEKILCISAFILGMLLGSAFDAGAATIAVPADFPTIQAGIAAANDGDTVLVAPGTYVENIDFLNKSISVESSAGPAETVIDGNNNGSAVSINNGAGRFSIPQLLQGFTIRNGNGDFGGGVAVSLASPTIRGNIFDSNHQPVGYFGGGIGGDNASPLVEQNTFQNNTCDNQWDSAVVSFINTSSPSIINNIFVNNPCRAIHFTSPSGTSPKVANNTIVGNRTGISDYNPSLSALPLYQNNIIVGNDIGFEVQFGTLPSEPIWENNLVYGNSTDYSGVPDQTGTNGNISADPLFLDSANNDFHLCQASPAIDAGNANGLVLPTTDFDGNPRVIDGIVDIGAYEFDPNAAPRVSFEANNVSGPAPLSVQFTSFTTINVTGYLWDFGDGTSSTQPNPVHSFSPGTYTVSLNVSGPTGTGTDTRNDLIVATPPVYTITASAGAGGLITPPGATTAQEGSSLTYTVTPNPSYLLTALIVDGATVGGASYVPVTYTFSSIGSDHTITAVFAHYFNYFGMQAENNYEALVTYTNGSTGTETDNITLDTNSSSFLDTEVLDGNQILNWFQVTPNSFLMGQQEANGTTIAYSPALPMVKTPLAAKMHWTSTCSAFELGVPIHATLTAKVSPQVLVSVPAGYFMAWPITYKLKTSARGRTLSTASTTWFAPYIGTVKSADSTSTTSLTAFSVGAGTVSFPPPVVTGTYPASATAGSTVAIDGFQFGSSQGTSVVRIGNVNCDQILSWTDTQIQCIVPDTASSGAVVVVTDTWTSNDSVILKIPPQITSVAPSSGTRKSTVQISGINFGSGRGKVKFGSIRAAVTQWSDTSISCIVPATAHLDTCPVTVMNSQGQSVLQGAFTVVK